MNFTIDVAVHAARRAPGFPGELGQGQFRKWIDSTARDKSVPPPAARRLPLKVKAMRLGARGKS